jgi:hypothetical protein
MWSDSESEIDFPFLPAYKTTMSLNITKFFQAANQARGLHGRRSSLTNRATWAPAPRK